MELAAARKETADNRIQLNASRQLAMECQAQAGDDAVARAMAEERMHLSTAELARAKQAATDARAEARSQSLLVETHRARADALQDQVLEVERAEREAVSKTKDLEAQLATVVRVGCTAILTVADHPHLSDCVWLS